MQALGATCNAGGGTHMHLLHIADWSHSTQGTSESAQTLQCWPLSDKTYYGNGFNLEYFIFTRRPWVEQFVLSPDNVWYGLLKLLFNLLVHIDEQVKPVELECAYISFCHEINLEHSGMK